MKRIILALLAVLLFAGCNAQTGTTEASIGTSTVPAETKAVQILPATAETTQPTEPELPWDPDIRWYSTYYFDKRPNPDPNIVEGVVRFNSLLRNENREPLTIESAHADFYMGTEVVAQEDFDADRLLDFLFHPREGDLNINYGGSLVLQLYSTQQEPGTYDRVITAYTLTDPEGNKSVQTFHFAINEEDITPFSFSDRTDWSPASRTEAQWIFHMFPYNTTDKTLEYVGMYTINFNDGLPMNSGFFDKSTVNAKALKDIQILQPGEMMHYQDAISHRFNQADQREHTMVYKDEAGELYLFTFCFALEEERSAPDPLPIYLYSFEEYGLTVLDTPELREQETGKAQYTSQEMRQMIESGLTLEQLSEKITNISEVQLFIQEAGIGFQDGDIKHRIDGTLWHFNDSPEVVFQQGYGNCGSGSNLINYLLRNDYDEQGYLQEAENKGGHIFNYFRNGDRYYIYDWTKMNMGRFDIFIANSLDDFSDAYVGTNRITDGENGDHTIILLYAYPWEGNHMPIAQDLKTPKGAPMLNILPSEIEEITTVLFIEKDQYAPIFTEGPPVSQWPEDAQ